jgi:hypothetical protein
LRRKRADFREAGATIACHLLVAATLPMSWPHYMYNGVEAFAASGVHHRCAHVVERFATGDESRSSRAASWCPIDDGKRLACAARTHIQKITMKEMPCASGVNDARRSLTRAHRKPMRCRTDLIPAPSPRCKSEVHLITAANGSTAPSPFRPFNHARLLC